jgi:hypothetical protein
MTAPVLTVYVNGVGQLSGDQLDTFEQTCDNFAQLRNFTGVSGVQVCARGQTDPGDGYGGDFWWNPGSTAPDDNLNVIVPYGATLGGWNRLALAFGNLTITGTLTVAVLDVVGAITGATATIGALTLTTPLAVDEGGTGANNFAPYAVLLGDGTSPIQTTGPGTTGQVLTSNGASANPTFQALPNPASLFKTVYDVTTSRAIGMTYTNTQSVPMFVSVNGDSNATNVPFSLTVSGHVIDVFNQPSNDAGTTVCGIVPAGATYEADGNFTLVHWTETW